MDFLLGSREQTWIQLVDSSRPRQTTESAVKVMLVVFFDGEGVIHHEFVPNGLGISGPVYRDILDRFRLSLRRKRNGYWLDRNSWALLHDGAPTHKLRVVQAFLQQHHIQCVPHPGYSPDLSPADYWFFARVKSVLKGN